MITAFNTLMNKNNYNIIIVTDIFGLNPHINNLVQALNHQISANIKVIEPYNGVIQSFTDDENAYQAFIKQCGHRQYAEKVNQVLKQVIGDTIIIGFSAGASAAWKNTEIANGSIGKKPLSHLKHVIGFYPSQIRNQLDINPCCEVTLIFPKKEPHFNLEETIQILSKSKSVSCFKTIYEHGFINPSSKNYSKIAAQYFSDSLFSITDISKINLLLTKQKAHFINGSNIRNSNEN